MTWWGLAKAHGSCSVVAGQRPYLQYQGACVCVCVACQFPYLFVQRLCVSAGGVSLGAGGSGAGGEVLLH